MGRGHYLGMCVVIGDITIITKQGPDKYINEYSSRIVFPGREPQDIASEILDFFYRKKLQLETVGNRCGYTNTSKGTPCSLLIK